MSIVTCGVSTEEASARVWMLEKERRNERTVLLKTCSTGLYMNTRIKKSTVYDMSSSDTSIRNTRDECASRPVIAKKHCVTLGITHINKKEVMSNIDV